MYNLNKIRKTALLALCITLAGNAQAQLSSNPDKFLGNITTSGRVEYGNEKFYTLWNQITCENETKWESVEGTNNSFNWGGADNAVNYAKTYNFPFKFHALVWGSQYPKWLESQTPEQRYKEIVQWMDAVKKKYPDLQLIDVVNEAVSGHQAGTKYFIEALGGTGTTGYDWIIKAFELAYERWPNAILIYNDFNTFQWNVDQYIDLVKTLRNAGAPIDAYGCQSHDLTDCSLTTFKNAMTKLQNALKMPMYSTEYDIGTTDDNKQLQRYKEQIPYMWEQDYVAGVTLWGYIYGRTWTNDGKDANGNTINSGHSGIIKDGKDRPAMTWLREYMKSDAAKNAKSPFPGMKKEASVYIKPAALNIEKGKPVKILVRAAMRTKTIEKIELYDVTSSTKGTLVSTMTEAPYEAFYTPSTTGSKTLKAVVTTTDGSTYERYGAVTSCNPRAAYKNTPQELPGVLQAENFDTGADGIAFHDSNSSKQGTGSSYRTDTGGIDVEKGGTGYTVGYTEVGEWMEYTVNVKEAGIYSYDIYYSAPSANPEINLALNTAGDLTLLTPEKLALPNTGDWSSFKTVHGRLLLPLKEGEQILRLTIAGGSEQYVTNIDKITFNKVDVNEDIVFSLANAPKTAMMKITNPITPEIQSPTEIKNVKYYIDGILTKTVTEAPFTFEYAPTVKGTYSIMAIATDVNDKQSKIASHNIEVVTYRMPYKEIDIPGIIEAEDFDQGEEGLSFHDSDTKDEGGAKYRTDNAGVDIVKNNDAYALGYLTEGEWTEYTINVKEKCKVTCKARVKRGKIAGTFNILKVNNKTLSTLWFLRVKSAEEDTEYETVSNSTEREFTPGKYVIRISVSKTVDFLIDNIEFVDVNSTGIENAVEVSDCTYSIYSVSGSYVGKVTANGSRELKDKIKALTGKHGIYVAKNAISGSAS
ncbi:MAG: endo-1,4-beta-xylanase, partial [Prevotella sp.]|nr:endo-1,4-beta-xylanase [Prevotella sp.]